MWQAHCRAEARRRAALDYLCRAYRPPLLSILLSWGHPQPDAEDLVQGFLLYFIRTNAVAKADPKKGRFRNFIVGVLKHYVAKQKLREARLKRGGWCRFVAFDALPSGGIAFDAGYLPDQVPKCDRDWAAGVSERALQRLQGEYAGSPCRRQLFRQLRGYLLVGEVPYAKLERKLGRPVATLWSDMSRMRTRYFELLREELAGSVAPDEVQAEFDYLLELLR